MNRIHPQTLLVILLGVVPIAVIGAGIISFLLLKSGYGLLVGAIAPFVASLGLVAVVSLVIGRAASNWRAPDGERPERKSDNGQTGKQDDV
jgi:Cu/Ag efflux pump CusA